MRGKPAKTSADKFCRKARKYESACGKVYSSCFAERYFSAKSVFLRLLESDFIGVMLLYFSSDATAAKSNLACISNRLFSGGISNAFPMRQAVSGVNARFPFTKRETTSGVNFDSLASAYIVIFLSASKRAKNLWGDSGRLPSEVAFITIRELGCWIYICLLIYYLQAKLLLFKFTTRAIIISPPPTDCVYIS